MEKFLEIVQMLAGMDWQGIIAAFFSMTAAVSAMFVAMIAFFAMIPGEFPENYLQKAVDFIAKFSRK